MESRADATPDAVAVVCEGRVLGYGELDRRANQVAHWLRARGVGPDTFVGVCTDRSLDMVVALLAVLKAGGAYVPLDPAYPAARLAFIAADTGIAVLLTQRDLADRFPEVPVRLSLDAGEPSLAALPEDRPEPAASPADLAYVIHTSGSTGTPKGVLVEHRSIVNVITALGSELGVGPGDRLLAVCSLSFDVAAFELFVPLAAGAAVVLADRATAADGALLAGVLDRAGITLLNASPTTWRTLFEAGWTGRAGLRAVCGGEAFPPELAERLLGCTAEVWNMYGPTETTLISVVHRVTAADTRGSAIPIGRPIAGTRLCVVDEGLAPVGDEDPGELLIAGAGVARGYLHRPELSEEKFLPLVLEGGGPQRFYRTGDLVRRRPDGAVEYLGRLDRQAKVRGFRIEPGEVEAALGRLPGVTACAVEVREDVPGDRRLVGYYITDSAGPAASGPALRRALAAGLPEHLVPSILVRLDAFPLTPNGKIDRAALPAPGGSRPELDVAFAAPATPTEQRLAALWSAVLGLDPGTVGADDRFGDLGGHSLAAARICALITREFGAAVSLAAFLAAATVRAVAAAVDAGPRAEAGPALVRDPERRSHPLTGVQRQLWALRQVGDAAPATTVASRFRLDAAWPDAGPAPALGAVLDALVLRHEVLRSVVRTSGGEPVALVRPAGTVPVAEHDLRTLSPLDRAERAEALARAAAAHTFDLAEETPLLRALALRLDERTVEVVLVTDHLVFDGASCAVVMTALADGVAAELCGGSADEVIPEPAVQMGDIAVHELALAELTERAEGLRAFWARELAGAEPPYALATRRGGDGLAAFRGERLTRPLDRTTAAAVSDFAARHGVSPFAVYAAALGEIVGRRTGAADVLLGMAVASRSHPDTAGLVGPLADVLPLRFRRPAGPTGPSGAFAALAGEVDRAVVRALDHQGLPGPELAGLFGARRRRGMSPTPVVISLQPADLPVVVRRDGVRVEMAGEVGSGGTRNPLSVFVNATAEGPELQIEYDVDSFTDSDVEALAEELLDLLAEPAGAEPAGAAPEPAGGPGSAVAELVAALWADELGDVQPAGRHGDFFARGGDAAAAARVTARLAGALGCPIPAHVLTGHPTLDRFCVEVERIALEHLSRA
ncbi:amino acid adenylation domain-containing protein [Spirillospora sp. NPDC052269]